MTSGSSAGSAAMDFFLGTGGGTGFRFAGGGGGGFLLLADDLRSKNSPEPRLSLEALNEVGLDGDLGGFKEEGAKASMEEFGIFWGNIGGSVEGGDTGDFDGKAGTEGGGMLGIF
eukprot:NODE_241_length_11910_cov_1.082381.p14 type:complete len:115 gc:universal NODE_241_length_11910_cov_1.082381:11468-11812(+)